MQIGFVGLLQLLFIAFKLAGIITWSWWVVLIPLWITLGLTLFVLLLVATLFVTGSRGPKFYREQQRRVRRR